MGVQRYFDVNSERFSSHAELASSEMEIKQLIQSKMQKYFSIEVPFPTEIFLEDYGNNHLFGAAYFDHDIHTTDIHYRWLQWPLKRLFLKNLNQHFMQTGRLLCMIMQMKSTEYTMKHII